MTLFEQELKKAKNLIATRSWFDAIDVNDKEVLADPLQQATRINRLLGAKLAIERMAAAVAAKLYRNRA